MSNASAFLRQHLGFEYSKPDFNDLKISTATLDARCIEGCNIDYELFALHVPCLTCDQMDLDPLRKWPPGTIIGISNGKNSRGRPPTKSRRLFKNGKTLWMWLEDKSVSIKLSVNGIHITGCKIIDQCAEAARYIQQHLQLLKEVEGLPVYEEYPYVVDIIVYMINYNFDLKVALNLIDFAYFIAENFNDCIYSPYDPNLYSCMMPVKFIKMKMSYTIHDNGRVSMCTSEKNPEIAERNIRDGYEMLHLILAKFHKSRNLC